MGLYGLGQDGRGGPARECGGLDYWIGGQDAHRNGPRMRDGATQFAGFHTFQYILSLRGKAEFQGWPAIPNSPETVGTNGIGSRADLSADHSFRDPRHWFQLQVYVA